MSIKKLRAFFGRQQPAPEFRDGWHSWDPHPWKHPWLTSKNLRNMRDYSHEFFERELRKTAKMDVRTLKIGFCGNLANNLYLRARPLRRDGLDIDIFLHPDDKFVMGQPAWEEFDGVIDDPSSLEDVEAVGVFLNKVPGVHGRLPDEADTSFPLPFLRDYDKSHFLPYVEGPYRATLRALHEKDVLWGAQSTYLSYLANRPYVVSQTGGDIWLEAARDDMLGHLQRLAYANARVFVVSNPWSYAHARRYGFKNLVYLPMTLDQTQYCPGHGVARKEWEARSGGNFFVLTTSRLDEKNKGSSLAIKGFAELAKHCPGARLVAPSWGNDRDLAEDSMAKLGIADRMIWLPLSGKEKVRDYLRSADVFIDQFVLGYFGAAGLEAMATGLPVIGRTEVAQYEALCETGAPPILQAEDAAEVAQVLIGLQSNPSLRKQIGEASRKWFLENHGSERWLPQYEALLSATAANHRVNWRRSPLRAPLGLDEIEYHRAGLAAAPLFPNYQW